MEVTNPTIINSSKNKTGIKVFAPASVANVACGFDVLGFAIEKPGDEIIVRHSDSPGLKITKITGGKLPYEVERNTAGYAALKLLEYLGVTSREDLPEFGEAWKKMDQFVKTEPEAHV